ncbi:MAG: NAD(P)-binding domain-containing protein [Saprospiraceae bacterium]|nr:NAD(P)-binding domain-containing protein [Saprospiraceae bacterium]
MQKIGIIGSGIVGKTLGKGFIKHGYSVMLGTRSPEKLEDWKAEAGEAAQIGSFGKAAQFGDILILALKGNVAEEVLRSIPAELLSSKTIIDATNPIGSEPPENGVLKFFTNLDQSLMEKLQNTYTDAHFVKAFNSVGSSFMVNPDFDGQTPSMFICGNSAEAKTEVREILDLFGWETEDMGKAESARAIEPLCMLWCIPGFLNNQWSHAFKLLKK